MEIIITLLEFLAVLAVVVVVHELGHFATAKAFGIQVNEFGFGFPPKLLGFRKGETVYTLNLIPIGGFVKLEGENDPTKPRSFASKSSGARFLVLVAGPVMNFALAVVLLAGLFMFTKDQILITAVSEGSPADAAGLQQNDIILAINGTPIDSFDELSNHINLSLDEEIEWLIRQNQSERTVRLVPRRYPPENQGATGISVQITGIQHKYPVRPPWEAVAIGFSRTWFVLTQIKSEFADWLSGGHRPDFAGPVGIAQVTGQVTREAGLISLIPLTALFSLSLAIFNILPIPALDGGRILFVLIEVARRGKRVPPEKEALVHMIGFMVLMILVIAITYNDITRIIEGGSLLP